MLWDEIRTCFARLTGGGGSVQDFIVWRTHWLCRKESHNDFDAVALLQPKNNHRHDFKSLQVTSFENWATHASCAVVLLTTKVPVCEAKFARLVVRLGCVLSGTMFQMNLLALNRCWMMAECPVNSLSVGVVCFLQESVQHLEYTTQRIKTAETCICVASSVGFLQDINNNPTDALPSTKQCLLISPGVKLCSFHFTDV